jgi:hypothetical protein
VSILCHFENTRSKFDFVIFFRQKMIKLLETLTQNAAIYNDYKTAFQENRNFFRRKVARIDKK